MTDAEAVIIAKIMLTADGWCVECGDQLLDKFALAFGGNDGMIQSVRKSREELRRQSYDNLMKFSEGTSRLMQVWEL